MTSNPSMTNGAYLKNVDRDRWSCLREDSPVRVIRPASGRVFGRVVTCFGESVPGLLIELITRRTAEPGVVLDGIFQSTGDDGEFEFPIPDGVDFGIYTEPEPDQHLERIWESVVWTAGAELLVTVRPGATIRGRIITSDKHSDSEFSVDLIPVDAPGVDSEGGMCTSFATKDKFEEAGVLVGLYSVEVKGRTRVGSRWRRWVKASVKPRHVRLRSGVRNLNLRVELQYPPDVT